MNKNREQLNCKFLGQLYSLASVFALVPLYKESRLIAYKFYSASIGAVGICAYVFTCWYVDNYMYKTVLTEKVLLLFNYTMSTALVIAAHYSAFVNFPSFQTFLTLFEDVDKLLGIQIFSEESNKILLQLVLLHFVFSGLIIYSVCLFIGLKFTSYYVGIHIFSFSQRYFYFIIVLIVINSCLSIKFRLKKVQDRLREVVKSYPKYNSDNCITQLRPHGDNHNMTAYKVRNVKEAFHKIYEIGDLYNDLFGFQMLFLFGVATGEFLEVINAEIINFGKSQRDERNLILAWFALEVVMCVVLAVTSDKTMKEAQQISTVCYSLLLDVPATSNNTQDRILREDLIQLAQEATHQCPYFSAAGFFSVDYSMLFGLLGTLTSYIIVLIQINT